MCKKIRTAQHPDNCDRAFFIFLHFPETSLWINPLNTKKKKEKAFFHNIKISTKYFRAYFTTILLYILYYKTRYIFLLIYDMSRKTIMIKYILYQIFYAYFITILLYVLYSRMQVIIYHDYKNTHIFLHDYTILFYMCCTSIITFLNI